MFIFQHLQTYYKKDICKHVKYFMPYLSRNTRKLLLSCTQSWDEHCTEWTWSWKQWWWDSTSAVPLNRYLYSLLWSATQEEKISQYTNHKYKYTECSEIDEMLDWSLSGFDSLVSNQYNLLKILKYRINRKKEKINRKTARFC